MIGPWMAWRAPSLPNGSGAVLVPGGAGGSRIPLKRTAPTKEKDLVGLRVLLGASGPLGQVARALEAARPLAERGAEVVVADGGLGLRTARELQRRAPFARLAQASDAESLLAVPDDAVAPEAVLVLDGTAWVDGPTTRLLMSSLRRSASGVAVAPVLCRADGGLLAPGDISDEGMPRAWMVRAEDLASEAQLRFVQDRGCVATVDRLLQGRPSSRRHVPQASAPTEA